MPKGVFSARPLRKELTLPTWCAADAAPAWQGTRRGERRLARSRRREKTEQEPRYGGPEVRLRNRYCFSRKSS